MQLGGDFKLSYMVKLKALIIPALLIVLASCSSKPSATDAGAENAQNSAETTQQTSADKTAATITDGLPTVIDFSATWCGPCRMVAPAVHELAENLEGKINFRFIDLDENRDLAAKYNVEAVPTFIILDAEGNEVNRIVGADIEGLKSAVDAAMQK